MSLPEESARIVAVYEQMGRNWPRSCDMVYGS
jgi:hypothetical protein